MKPEFYLASSSPRRIELLGNFIKPLKMISPNIDETPRRNESPSRLVARVSKEKAHAVVQQLLEKKSVLVLAADTTVTFPHSLKALNKPRSNTEATQMLKSIAGKTHWVLTSFSILLTKNGEIKKSHSQTVRSCVEIMPLSSKEIQNYLSRGESMDKAGAYAAQGVGGCLVRAIRGSVTNVIGLPMTEVIECLKTEFKFKIL